MDNQESQQNAKIHNVRIDSHFTTTFNETSQNNSLSFSARGLLWYLLSLPENWNISRKHLYKVYTGEERGNGRTAIDRMFRELMDQEYIVYTAEKDKKGHWVHRYDVYPMPFPRFQKMFPDAGNQRADNLSAVNGGSNTNQQFRTEQPMKENRRRTAQDTRNEELDSLSSGDDEPAAQERHINREDLPEGLSDRDQKDILLKCPDKERLRNAVSYATNGNVKPENLAALIISNYQKRFKPSQRKNKRAVDQRHREEKKSRQKRNMELFEEMLKDKPFKAKFVICSSTVDPEVKFVQCPDNEPVGFATDRFYQTIEKKIEKEEKNFTKKSKGDIL